MFRNMMAQHKALLNADVWEVVMAGVPVDGTSGSFAGEVGKGSKLVNTLTGIWYTNTGTKASPTWTTIGSQS